MVAIERFHHVMKLLPTSALRHLGVQVVGRSPTSAEGRGRVTSLFVPAESANHDVMNRLRGICGHSFHPRT